MTNSTEISGRLLALPTRTFRPRRYRPGNIGTWSGHLAFANDLIAALKPALLVELGTHYGESYFGMCQAVEENGISCKCYAVDTWKGDPHAGFYGDAVFDEVNDYNAQTYASFSQLLRTSFDAAREHFAEHTIDLLHIDGLHTYDAVRHDFEGWFTKVRPGGVVLFHDIAVRHADFGVWRLWEELASRFPHFEFIHSWGLGVLRKPGGSAEEPEFLRSLFSAAPAEEQFLRHYYTLQAESLEHRHRTSSLKGAGETELRLFPNLVNGYTEDTSVATRMQLGEWQHIVLELPQGSAYGPIRIDPADCPCLIEIAGAQLQRAADGAVLQNWTNADIQTWVPAADVIVLPGQNPVRLLSTGRDPQLLLPQMEAHTADQPLTFSARVRANDDLAAAVSILRGISGGETARAGMEAAIAAAKNEAVASQAARDAALLRSQQLSAEVRHLQAERVAVVADYRRIHAINESLHAEVVALKGRIEAERERWLKDHEALKAELDIMLRSKSWRITAPLRRLFRTLR